MARIRRQEEERDMGNLSERGVSSMADSRSLWRAAATSGGRDKGL